MRVKSILSQVPLLPLPQGRSQNTASTSQQLQKTADTSTQISTCPVHDRRLESQHDSDTEPWPSTSQVTLTTSPINTRSKARVKNTSTTSHEDKSRKDTSQDKHVASAPKIMIGTTPVCKPWIPSEVLVVASKAPNPINCPDAYFNWLGNICYIYNYSRFHSVANNHIYKSLAIVLKFIQSS